MKFRFHRGGLDESMATAVDVDGWDGLVAHIASQTNFSHFTPATMKVVPYGFDDRIGWDTHLVSDSYGVIGMTDGPCSPGTPGGSQP
jgi:hypothetical protein